MRWFGGSWGAPICTIAKEAPTPDGRLCAHHCGHGIRYGDIGLLVPFMGAPTISEDFVNIEGQPHLAYHLVCFFDEIGIRR